MKKIATMHTGNLGRWFEQLCRIKWEQIRRMANNKGNGMKRKELPAIGAVYAFWWTGKPSLLGAAIEGHSLVLKGPKGKPVRLQFNKEWLGIGAGVPVPLYVGTTTAGLHKRIPQHLVLGKERLLQMGKRAEREKSPTTACQLRAGVDRLFPNEGNTRKLVLQNIGLSYVKLDGDDDAANRFYLEDLAIGLMRPPFNVGVEH